MNDVQSLPRIAFFANLPAWSMGANKGSPSFWLTLTGLARHFRVDVFFLSGGLDPKAQLTLPNVRFFSVPVIGLAAANQLRGLSSSGLTGFVGWTFADHWAASRFVSAATRLAGREHHKTPYVLSYGYEVFGAEAAWQCALRWRIPSVGRFMGTLLPQELPLRTRIRYHFHIRALTRRYDRIIMADDGTQGKQKLISWGVPAETISFWRNGVGLPDKTEIAEKPGKTSKPVVLAASRLVGWKKTDRVIRAFVHVLKACPKAQLRIAGDGPMRAGWEQLALDLGIAEHTIFLGALPRNELFREMWKAWVFVSAFDLSNLGNQTFEAIARELPVVAIGFGDTSTVVIDGKTGRTVDSQHAEDPLALAAPIVKLLTSDKLRSQLAVSCRKFSAENFCTWSQRMETEQALLRELIGNR